MIISGCPHTGDRYIQKIVTLELGYFFTYLLTELLIFITNNGFSLTVEA
ncbi:hypothetical protein B6N60_03144 [Richelia sinica FACHB-800]|uniref:Uncharacterized protein n=1 Tax=Richelia sinica FACHB-800 TaxID=1357546 RepID=A0A975T989_9NOST|nr:hypothetical protein B6N60_03144 [Richelia sinica FACHB-800]